MGLALSNLVSVVVAASAAGLVPLVPAYAVRSPSEPPTATLRVAGYGAFQSPHLNGYRSVGADCHAVSSSAIRTFPRRYLVEPGRHAVRIVLLAATRPDKMSLRVWHELDRTGQPAGRPKHPSFRVDSNQAGGDRVIVRFVAHDVARRHDYIELEARWHVPDCGATTYVPYTFHLRAAEVG
jgi:hypothetical protein